MIFEVEIYQYKYVAVFLLAFVGGPTLALLCGFLVGEGRLDAALTLGTLVLANFIPDVLMYFLGRRLRRGGVSALHKKFPMMEKYREGVEIMWKEFFLLTLVLSKVSLGLAMPFLASAGYSKVPFRKYIVHTVGLDIILITVLLFIGAVTGTGYERIVAFSNYAAGLFALLLVILVSLVVRVGARRARKELLKRSTR